MTAKLNTLDGRRTAVSARHEYAPSSPVSQPNRVGAKWNYPSGIIRVTHSTVKRQTGARPARPDGESKRLDPVEKLYPGRHVKYYILRNTKPLFDLWLNWRFAMA
ncbi:MAG: hypothetical protein IT356_04405 [Gemmatimonadaceae bacterium]|nr:hypothetical protein [Gemmatimonadaceae bacterium]